MIPSLGLGQHLDLCAQIAQFVGQERPQPIERWLVVGGRFHLHHAAEQRDHIVLVIAQVGQNALVVGHICPFHSFRAIA